MIWIIVGGIILATILIAALLQDLKGSTIFIYGPRASGKTSLAKFLIEGEIYEEYKKTIRAERFEPKGKKIKMSEFQFNIERIITSPGSLYPDKDLNALKIPFEIIRNGNYEYLFYVFDISKIVNIDEIYIQCIYADVDILKKYVVNKKILLIGTHLDLLPLKNIEQDRKVIEEQISDTQVIKKIIRELENNNKISGPIIGSLNNKIFAGELTYRILKAMHKLKSS